MDSLLDTTIPIPWLDNTDGEIELYSEIVETVESADGDSGVIY
jgi:hypothetical protein